MRTENKWLKILLIVLAIAMVSGLAWFLLGPKAGPANVSSPKTEVTDEKVKATEPAPSLTGETQAQATEPEAEAKAAAIELTDLTGRTVTLAEPAKTVVSLGPNMTEILFALGAGDRLLARTDYCDYPEAASALPSIGTLMEPNIEKIIELDPDLVLASTHVAEEVIEQLSNAGIPTLFLYDEQHVEGLKEIFKILGQALNLEDAAKSLSDNVFSRMKAVEEHYKNVEEKPTVYYVVGFGEGGDWTATGETFIHELLEMAGAENIAKDAAGWSFSAEKLLELDPDYILLPAWAEASFAETKPYSELTAVKEGRILLIDDNEFSRQGPRNADGVEHLAAQIHP